MALGRRSPFGMDRPKRSHPIPARKLTQRGAGRRGSALPNQPRPIFCTSERKRGEFMMLPDFSWHRKTMPAERSR